MTPAERRALIGDDAIADARRQALAAPPPPPEVLAALRRILTRPAGRTAPVRAAVADRGKRRAA